jgi:hypothetical protein
MYQSRSAQRSATNARRVNITGASSRKIAAASDSVIARADARPMVAPTCHLMRSSTLGRRSRMDAITHSVTNAGTTNAGPAIPRSFSGSHGFQLLISQPAANPAIT